ncbi:toll/interleukin-1 receptor domain-containing protein [Actinomycetospora sp. NBRC 106378]|uniref:toll/interleukin-1 receptor domain-containing protein n=1 Tax=Actinomycetospora sp. NBRC 106378 TaxID=3032208 RepID=UPI0024A20CB9|nr:toll/interleukin-1 receptor domain-containing protein [Actinomycetospora sp. NBRC 106378]GLZ51660.1 hypothetical protein Acsp07_12770 [Actinomycetospora sp. NBRC 106378]
MTANSRWWEQALARRGGALPIHPADSHAGAAVRQPPAAAPRTAFLSHSSVDGAVAREVCAELESQGMSCWMAPRDIVPGTEWASAIVDGIARSSLAVVLLSTSSVVSHEVRREVERAYKEGKPVLPVKIDASTLEGTLAYYLAEVHWIDLTRRPVRRHLSPLVARTRDLLGVAAPAAYPAVVAAEIPEVRLDRLF